MRYAVALLAGTLFLVGQSYAQNRLEVADLAHHPIESDFASGGRLELHLRAGEIHIVGSDDGKITVRAGGRRGSDSTDIRALFDHFSRSGKLSVTGGPDGDVSITVSVPKSTDLKVHVTAGDVEVQGITGNKDIELLAGNLTVGVGDPADYFRVQASVTTGNIDATPFGESRGGLFRSFQKTGHGRYKLVAHVGAGDLKLK